MNSLFATGKSSPPSPSSYVSPFSSNYDDSDSDESLVDRRGRGLVLARLIRHACSGNGPLADSLKVLTSELLKLNVISDRVARLATEQTSGFDKNFYDTFKKHMEISEIPLFWKTDLDTEHTSRTKSSRYLNDFEELKYLGGGAYGKVVICKNKLDLMSYAVKKIPLKNGKEIFNQKISREVAALSRLQHRHVVRYYQAWFEVHIGSDSDDSAGSDYHDRLQEEVDKVETYLYIQMEYCPSTLDELLDPKADYDEHQRLKIFRQIVEGLVHIHARGFVHRDLTPKNIFFDVYSNIKIGHFGLVKFLKQDESGDGLDPEGTLGVSDSPTNFGTRFYTAPEVVETQKKNLELIQNGNHS